MDTPDAVAIVKKLMKRILFGSDFTINLMAIESYNKYLEIFSHSGSFSPTEKNDFCSTNPKQFLFPENEQ